ncbi:hypothetical protein PZE06_03855 [Robertmurraya sp. DFI.2.37]|uniref:hypothetical protein n=1 Tax=Robertmurraya sp. DFI.2.37 TaxID=3031819 RepID=UPI0012476F28|nr:hypothetical protein [Robertmurraya sp. DFI.2.37]MDF1507313.1 hypothetical protein [Robertmurraya sp. DFI.2.37]
MELQQARTNEWYTAILVLSILIPVLYVIYLLMILQENGQSIEGLLKSQPIYGVLMLVAFINPIWGHFLKHIPKGERVKEGRGDRFLTYLLVSQIAVGNIVMLVLALLAKRRLPRASEPQPLTILEKMVSLALLALSLFAGYLLLRFIFFV